MYKMNDRQNSAKFSDKLTCTESFLLFTESRSVTETSVIPHETYYSDICQVVV